MVSLQAVYVPADDYSDPAITHVFWHLDSALVLFKQNPELWRKLQRDGMAQDWSWPVSARKYVEVFKAARAKLRG